VSGKAGKKVLVFLLNGDGLNKKGINAMTGAREDICVIPAGTLAWGHAAGWDDVPQKQKQWQKPWDASMHHSISRRPGRRSSRRPQAM
jgi:hypothetical protein